MDEILAAEEYGLSGPAKNYPKCKLLPQFDDETSEPVPSLHNAVDRPPRGRDKAATQTEYQPAPPHYKGKNQTACGHTYDLRQDLNNRAGPTRSIYRSRGHSPTRDDGYLFERDKPSHARADNRRRTPSELRRDTARYRGAHTLSATLTK